MSRRNRKAKGWRRAIVIFAAIACLALGGLMASVPDGETFFRQTGKWILAGILGVGGLWFAVIAIRGDARQINKTLDEMSSGI